MKPPALPRAFALRIAGLVFLLGASLTSCASLPDYPPDLLIGESYYEAKHKRAERALLFKLGDVHSGIKTWPLFFFTHVPGARYLMYLENYNSPGGYTSYFFPLFFGGLMNDVGIDDPGSRADWKPGRENMQDGLLNLDVSRFRHLFTEKLAKDEVLIFHRIKLKSKTNTDLDVRSMIMASLLLGRINHEGYSGVLAKIKVDRLLEYLKGKNKLPGEDLKAPAGKTDSAADSQELSFMKRG